MALSAIALLMAVNRKAEEPVARGRPLSYWLARLGNRVVTDPPWTAKGAVALKVDAEARQAARAAIKEMGTNVLPVLTGMLRRHDSPGRKQFISWVSKHPWLKSRLKFRPPAEEDWRRALEAINCVGSEAQPALPDVLPLLTNQDSSVKSRAFHALTAISPKTEMVRPVVPALMQALGDRDSTMRSAAIAALGALRPPPPEAAPAFVQLLTDPNDSVSEAAMNWLVEQGHAVVIPVLDKQLHDKDSYVVTTAASHLGTFGAAAAGSAPRLKELLNDPLITVRMAATNALAAITGQLPSQSAPAKDADITINFPSMPLPEFLDFYGNLAGQKMGLAVTPKPGVALRVITASPLTKSQALQLLEEVLKEQAGLVIVHGQDGVLTAVAKPEENH